MPLSLRALLAFLALPGVVGVLVPLILMAGDPWRQHGTWIGWPVLSAGATVLVICVQNFYARGRGTLAPWDPPRRLVVSGLYRLTRNPMYLGVISLVSGLALVSGSWVVAGYAVLLAVLFHLRVTLYEEPVLAKQFDHEWYDYCRTVNRWIPRLRS